MSKEKFPFRYGRYILVGIIMTLLILIFSLIMSAVAATRNRKSTLLFEETGRLYNDGPLTQSAPSLGSVSEDSVFYKEYGLSPVRARQLLDNTNLSSTDINVVIDADFVKKGLIYQPTYKVQFEGAYMLKNSLEEKSVVSFEFPFPVNTESGEISNVKLLADGEEVENIKKEISTTDEYGYTSKSQGVFWEGEIEPNTERQIVVSYDTVGISDFIYQGIENSKGAQDFGMNLRINGTREYDVSEGLSVDTREFGEGYVNLTWDKEDLFSKPSVSVSVGDRLNPSTQVSRVYFTMAPVYVVFMIVLVVLAVKSNAGLGTFDMFLFSVLYTVFFPLFHYLSSFTIDPTMEVFLDFDKVTEFSMPLYGAFLLAWVVVGGLILYLLGRVTNFKFALKTGLPSLVLFMGFFPLVVTIPEYSILLVLIGVIALLTIVVQSRGSVAK